MRRKNTAIRIAIEGELSIFTANDRRQGLIEAFAPGKDVEVDLSRVNEIDSAGLQLMLAAQREAAARNTRLSFVDRSQAVLDILELCELTDQFGDPVPPKA